MATMVIKGTSCVKVDKLPPHDDEVRRILLHDDEVQFYLDNGCTIYRDRRFFNGEMRIYYFIEVFTKDLIKMAR